MAVLDRLYFCTAYNLNPFHSDGLYHESVHIDTIGMELELSILHFKGLPDKISIR